MISEKTLNRIKDDPCYPYVKALLDFAESTWIHNKDTIRTCAEVILHLNTEYQLNKPSQEELRQKALQKFQLLVNKEILARGGYVRSETPKYGSTYGGTLEITKDV